MTTTARWSGRQQVMLQEMGIRLWLPPADEGPVSAPPAVAEATRAVSSAQQAASVVNSSVRISSWRKGIRLR